MSRIVSRWIGFRPAGGEDDARRDKFPMHLYLLVLVFFAAVGAILGYFIFLRGFELGGHSSHIYDDSSPPRHITDAEVNFYIALPGIIGGTLGFIYGAYICVRIRMDEIAEEKRRKEIASRPPFFESTLEP